VVKDEAGKVVELRCEWDADSRGGTPKDGRKVKGTLHWVSAKHAVRTEVRLYDRLFLDEDPAGDDDADLLERLNPQSLTVYEAAALEPALAGAKPGERFQFERLGYFCVDSSSEPDKPVFNRTIGLRDSWAKIKSKG
jgi:glutaminyl-tRNA synthetase